MKKDLATAIGTAIIGAVAAFFICNLFLGEIEPVTFKNVDSSVSADLSEPSAEVFNYRSLNPTVEVYVGECKERNQFGECIDEETLQEFEEIVDNSTQEND